MAQNPRNIVHSLFSLDPNASIESRNPLNPYNHPYSQYPYPYPYPYSAAPHHSFNHTNVPTTSSHIISSSLHTIPQAAHSLSDSQGNNLPYSVGVHGIRQLASDLTVQGSHIAEIATSENSQSSTVNRNLSMNSRGGSIGMIPVAEQQYNDGIRSVSNNPQTPVDTNHSRDCSQPTDLRMRSNNVKVYGSIDHSSNNFKDSISNKKLDGHSNSIVTQSHRVVENKGHLEIANNATNQMTREYMFQSNMYPHVSPSLKMTELPCGDPRPPVPTQSSSSSVIKQDSESRIPEDKNKQSLEESNNFTTKLVPDQGILQGTREPYGNESHKIHPAEDLRTSTNELNNYTGNSLSKIKATAAIPANTSFPNTDNSSVPLESLLYTHGDYHNGKTVEQKDSVIFNENQYNASDCQEPLTNFPGDQDIENEEEEFDEDGDDFDSESDSEASSSPEYTSPYIEFNDVANGVFKNINSIAGPAKPFQCENCDATFTTKGNLKVHKRIHTGEKPYVCEHCGKAFTYCASYQSHKLIHSGHRAFQCDFCEREFFRSEHLERHRRRHTGEKPFKCTECDATFAASDVLTRHTRTHTGERPYQCNQCNMSFAYKSTFLRHQFIHSDEVFKCDNCGMIFKDPLKLDKHMKKHTDSNYIPGNEKSHAQRTLEGGIWMISCEFCQMKFKRKSDYYLHRQTHTGEKPFICEICNAPFIKRKYLDIHMRTHTGDRPFKCEECKSAFKTQQALKFHRRIHTGERPFKCEVCEFAFTQKAAMKTHMRIHTGEKPFKCDQCDASFRHSGSLTIHKRIHTGERPYTCNLCGASFTQKPHLNLHKRSHLGIKAHNCDECDASFTKKDYLIAHKSKHAVGNALKIEALAEAGGEHALKCPECNMVFTHPSSLATHMRKHTGERPFKCEECDASFLYSSNLTTHRRKHTGEKPYKCDQCDSSFILRSYLTMHLRKHSGERPFKCDECNACFTQKTHLSTHRRIHTGECPYKCQLCGEAFRDGANFWRHKKKHMDGEESTVVVKKNENKGRGRGRGRNKSKDSVTPLRRTTRIRRPVINFEELYEQLMINSDGDSLLLKDEPEDLTPFDDSEDPPYIPINPLVEIKMEGDEEENSVENQIKTTDDSTGGSIHDDTQSHLEDPKNLESIT